jgi:YegS/Rv2252/BmrU family lipid kinase
MKLCVIFNPTAARGRARQRLERLRHALAGRADFRPTQFPGHAEELAFEAARAGLTTVAAAGGDGTVHEVANGVLRAGNPDAIFGVFPMGSANDYAHSLGIDLDASLQPIGGQVREVDVGWVRTDQGRERYFVNSLGLGFSGAVTVESKKIRRLQGLWLYSLAFYRALWRRFAAPLMTITLDGKIRQGPTFSLTLGIGRREGNLVVTPRAILDDGLFEALHVTRVSRWEVIRFMPRLAFGRELPGDHPAIWMSQCQNAQVQSETPLTVHLDGELLCLPVDDVRALEVRCLPRKLRVLVPQNRTQGAKDKSQE